MFHANKQCTISLHSFFRMPKRHDINNIQPPATAKKRNNPGSSASWMV